MTIEKLIKQLQQIRATSKGVIIVYTSEGHIAKVEVLETLPVQVKLVVTQ